MSTTTQPSPRLRARRRRHTPYRLLAAAFAAAAAILIVATQADLRVGEAVLARWFVQSVTAGQSVAAGTIVYFGIGTDQVTGISITALCSTVVFIVPLIALVAAMLAITRAGVHRVLLAGAVGISVVVVCNFVRFASAAWAFDRYGRDGFDIVHRYAGSIFVIIGFVAAIVLTLTIGLREPHRKAPRRAPRGGRR
ncbi:exosortase S [Microbacterium laevaniformans]|uniref:exosortase S n=1 Tax=Microbacterium laevaniformans TaxID=36807 RepID=UPI00363B332E